MNQQIIETLTVEQQEIIVATRDQMFSAATSTTTDREKAISAVAVIVAPAMSKYEVHFVNNPQDAASLIDSLRDSLIDSLRDSLWDSLIDSLRDSLWDSLWDSLRDSLWGSLRDSLLDSLWDSLRDSLWDSLRDSLWGSLRDSLLDSLWDSLRDSLWGSLRASLRASLSASLRGSLLDSLWGSGRNAFYVAPIRAGIVSVDENIRARIEAFVSFAESAFAMWVIPGHVIVLAKPKRTVVTDGKLVDVEW